MHDSSSSAGITLDDRARRHRGIRHDVLRAARRWVGASSRAHGDRAVQPLAGRHARSPASPARRPGAPSHPSGRLIRSDHRSAAA